MMIRGHSARALACVAALLLAAASTARAQHEHMMMDSVGRDSLPRHDMSDMRMMDGPLGISHTRMGSGTAWLPDASPMRATHEQWGTWSAMVHGVAYLEYDDQGSRRGDAELGMIDWEMLMAMRRVGSGTLHLHAMTSLEPLTLGGKGYPLLLQSGESYRGAPLVDRQHPHDLFMELAAIFEQPLSKSVAFQLYGGPVGEPALGPVAFMHRPSAQSDPLAPLGHHWQDATHLTFGVVTAGVYSRAWKLEGSWFNGREPDENRYDFDLRPFDSWSGRLTLAPSSRVTVAGWYGWLKSPEGLHPEESLHRYGASALYSGKGSLGGEWSAALIWGANVLAGGRVSNSVAAETNLELGTKSSFFARAEYVRKSAEELVLTSAAPATEYDVSSVVLGYLREVAPIKGGTIGIGGRFGVNFIPEALRGTYGTRTPVGGAVYVRLRPGRMQG